MDITIEQARALEAVVIKGTIQKAALSLNKGHSAVLYLIKSLETQSGLKLFDRSGYRNQLSPSGQVVLKYCRQLIQTKNEFSLACKKLKGGWEPQLKLIYDGVINFRLIADALVMLKKSQVPTGLKVLSAHLFEVENMFNEEQADMMVTILPIQRSELSFVQLKSIRMLLVAFKDHPLAQKRSNKISSAELQEYPYLRIGDTSPQLGLSTEQLEFNSSFLVNDFATKKQAILMGLGYGWLPEYLIRSEIESKKLRTIKTEIENNHELHPRLYHQKEELLGKTALQLLRHFQRP